MQKFKVIFWNKTFWDLEELEATDIVNAIIQVVSQYQLDLKDVKTAALR